MPKIKVKNIPATTRERICYRMDCCSECPFYSEVGFVTDKGTNTTCMFYGRHDLEETVVELSEKDFPTNREWLESLSDNDLANFLTLGIDIDGCGTYVNIDSISRMFMQSQSGVEEWLSKPCQWEIYKIKDVHWMREVAEGRECKDGSDEFYGEGSIKQWSHAEGIET